MNFDQILEQALEWYDQGKGVAVASVMETWGSAPRPAGSQLAINSESEMAGSVSGGCVEAAVVAEGLDALETGRPRILEYGISDETAFSAGLACGGTIRILVEPLGIGQGPDPELYRELTARRAARRAAAYLVNTKTWERKVVTPDTAHSAISERFLSDKSGTDGDWFIGINNPPIRLAVVGAVHIAQPLLAIAELAGYDTVLIDPRSAFLTEQRFPQQRLVATWPDEALANERIDSRTAVVTLSHDPKIDDPAIIETLNSNAFYLGCLGSRKTHKKRFQRLVDHGFSKEDIDKISAPIGLDIGSKSPTEIAISIVGEIIERIRQPATSR